ncbi:MAG: TonB-dependent receptor [Shewanella psychromarinicola]|jgi:TonB-dependent receptor|uniref:TonB-dependent receptor n=1 Tax=Shewanella psychromarinicola TaxID=2487742 RepID=UPI003EEFC6EC
MKTTKFTKTKLATSLSLVLGVSSMLPAYAADEAAEENIEVVQVKGIRGSLIKSMDIKRSSQGVVDAISAEDMGKFPDTNLAESLQRISGVSIDRSNGEGSKITVRGLGPDFNLVTLNGRQMPSSNLEATTTSSSRSFDFGNIASEAISGVEVYKTAKADISSGGIGATVNIQTAKPFDNPGQQASFGVKGVMDQSTDEGDNITPELSGIYSNTFADDTFGIGISFSHQERNGATKEAVVPQWHTQAVAPVDGWNGGINNTDWDEGDTFNRPQQFRYNFTEFERKRDNGQVVFQYAPTDDLILTADYTMSQQTVSSTSNGIGAWFWEGETIDGNLNKFSDGPNHSPLVWHSGAGPDLSFSTSESGQKNENDSIGVNLEWNVNDNLTLELDYHNSSATSKSDSPYGNSSVIEYAVNSRQSTTIDFSSDFPVMSIAQLDGLTGAPSELITTGSSLRNSQFTNDLDQIQLRGKYVFDDGFITSVDFGVSKTDNDVRASIMTAQRDTWGGEGSVDDVSDSLFTPGSSSGQLSDLPTTGQNAAGDQINLFDLFYNFSFADAAREIASYAAPDNSGNQVSPGIWPCSDRFCVNDNWTRDEMISEEYQAIFAQVNMEFDISNMPLNVSVGFRYEDTDVNASAMVPAYTGIDWVSNNEFATIDTGESVFTDFNGSYDNFLPNLDASLGITDDLIARASIGKTLSRPTYNHIRGGVGVGEVRQGFATANSGDPGLVPYESTNFDFSLEWYFAPASYASVGYFKKDIENFIGTRTSKGNLFDLRNPTSGPRYAEALAAVGSSDNAAIRQYIFENYPESSTVTGADSNGNPTGNIHSTAEDSLIDFDITKPFNERDASIDGIEIAFQHTLEMGFGMQANYTFVSSDAEYDPNVFDSQFALPGLSDTANVVAFYENYGFSLRVAYNWRDEFLVSTDNNLNNPRISEAYSQIDINASYNITENFIIFAEGINITDETQRMYSRHSSELLNAIQSGARYNIGARYTF